MRTTAEWIAWRDEDPKRVFPMQDVTCMTQRCPNRGRTKSVPDIGQEVECGGCRRTIRKAGQ